MEYDAKAAEEGSSQPHNFSEESSELTGEADEELSQESIEIPEYIHDEPESQLVYADEESFIQPPLIDMSSLSDEERTKLKKL